MMTADETTIGIPLDVRTKATLLVRMWSAFLAVHIALRRRPLEQVVVRLGSPVRTRRDHVQPGRLGRAVSRGLRIGPWTPRCLIRSLVLYGLLREQGDPAELVIGLRTRPLDHGAHSWVELDGVDLGPAPGRSGWAELVRYPRPADPVTDPDGT